MKRTLILQCLMCLLSLPLLAGEDYQLFKEGKNYWYKDNWSQAADSFESLVKRYPDGPFYIKGLYFLGYCRYKLDQKDQAFEHLSQLIEASDPERNVNVVEDAKSLRLRIAFEHAEKDPEWKSVLIDALNDSASGIRLQAASWLAKLDDNSGMGVLFDVVENEGDHDLVDRAVRNILLIAGENEKQRLENLLDEKRKDDQGRTPKMVRLVIKNLDTNQETIKINLPMSLFPVLLKSLTPEQRDLIEEEGFDLEAIARSLKSVPAGTTLFEVKTPDEEIKLYLD